MGYNCMDGCLDGVVVKEKDNKEKEKKRNVVFLIVILGLGYWMSGCLRWMSG